LRFRRHPPSALAIEALREHVVFSVLFPSLSVSFEFEFQLYLHVKFQLD